jgi:hypothetical protein
MIFKVLLPPFFSNGLEAFSWGMLMSLFIQKYFVCCVEVVFFAYCFVY